MGAIYHINCKQKPQHKEPPRDQNKRSKHELTCHVTTVLRDLFPRLNNYLSQTKLPGSKTTSQVVIRKLFIILVFSSFKRGRKQTTVGMVSAVGKISAF